MRSLPSRAVLMARLALLPALGFGCASCSEEYLARRDTLSPSSGDALKANEAIQTIDPKSPSSQQSSLVLSGEQLQHAIESYRNPSSGTANAALGGSAQIAPNTGGATALH